MVEHLSACPGLVFDSSTAGKEKGGVSNLLPRGTLHLQITPSDPQHTLYPSTYHFLLPKPSWVLHPDLGCETLLLPLLVAASLFTLPQGSLLTARQN